MGERVKQKDPRAEFEDGRITLEEYPVGVRIRILAAQMYAADGIGTWCIWKKDKEERHFSTCIYETEYYYFLELGNCHTFMEEQKEDKRPVVMSDALGLTWLAEYVCDEFGNRDILVIIGPMFMSSSSLKKIEKAMAERISSVQMRLNFMRTLSRIPVVSFMSLMHYGKIMHFTLQNEFIGQDDFVFKSEPESGSIQNKKEETPSSTPGTKADAERLRRGEQMILTAVREGNLKYTSILEDELAFSDTFVGHTGDDLRDGKISVTVFTALCSRAAVEGGLLARTAGEMEVRYYSEIEACKSIMELKSVMDKMLNDYVGAVVRHKENESASRSIRECCDYIRANVMKPLTTEGIASEMGYTPYYLSRKFTRETGVKIGDYIKQTKIEYAKVALLSTNKSIQEISDMLQFSSRNYFTKVFASIVGVTPSEFREQIGHPGTEG